MIFLVLVFILAAALYFQQQQKDKKRKQCSYGCVKAYELLKNPQKYESLKALFDTLNSPAERYFYSVSMSRLMNLQALEKWTEDFPDSGDALLCYGARLLQWSWDARGYGRGAEISSSQWEAFFSRLENTREILLKSAEKSPQDPTPWTYLIMVATWHSDSEEVKYQYFNEAISRDPNNWAAHMHMVIALSEKWGGNNQEMIAFARKASNQAPKGSDLKVVIVKAYIEYWKYLDIFDDKPEDARDFIHDKIIKGHVIDAYNDSFALASFCESKVSIFARYNLSGWFWITGDRDKLNDEFIALGNDIEDIHWRWVGTEGELQHAKTFVANG